MTSPVESFIAADGSVIEYRIINGQRIGRTIPKERSMNDETYNGWVNRETWATALHLGNDQGLYNGAREAVVGLHYYEPTEGRDRVPMTCKVCGVLVGDHGPRPDDAIKDYVETLHADLGDMLADGADNRELRMMFDEVGSLWRVDWRAVAEAFAEDES